MDPRENGPAHHDISPSHYHQYPQQPVYSTWRYDPDHIYGDVTTSFSWEHPPGRPENKHETRGGGLEQESELERDTSRSTSTAVSYCPSASADSDKKLYPWQPGFLRRFPYMGLVPLLLSIACTVVAISIILVSNEKLVDDWSGVMQPGVLLAYSSTVANTLLGFSFAYGWATQFWVRAVSGRMRLTDLYYHYEGATSVWGAINSLARGRVARVSLVSLLVTVTSLLRGPLSNFTTARYSLRVDRQLQVRSPFIPSRPTAHIMQTMSLQDETRTAAKEVHVSSGSNRKVDTPYHLQLLDDTERLRNQEERNADKRKNEGVASKALDMAMIGSISTEV